MEVIAKEAFQWTVRGMFFGLGIVASLLATKSILVVHSGPPPVTTPVPSAKA